MSKSIENIFRVAIVTFGILAALFMVKGCTENRDRLNQELKLKQIESGMITKDTLITVKEKR